MLQMLSRITLSLIVAGAFLLTAWGGAKINRLPRPGAAFAFQESVSVSQLPGPVTTAIKNRFPKGELLSAEKDFDHGMVKYEVKVRSEGQIFDIDVTPRGKILKIERDDH